MKELLELVLFICSVWPCIKFIYNLFIDDIARRISDKVREELKK